MKKTLVAACLLLAAVPSFAQWQKLPMDDQNIYGFLSHGTLLFAGTGSHGILRSKDNGASWDTVNTGLTTTGINCFSKISDTLFAASEGIFRSVDGGDTWTPVRSGLPNRSVNAMLAYNGMVYAGTDTGVYYSSNYGDTWLAGNKGFNSQVISLAQMDTLLIAGTGNGGTIASGLSNLNWISIKTGITNNYVNALAVSGNLLFAGTSGDGVFRSSTRGSLWTPVNNGLTEKHVYGLLSRGSDLFAGTDSGVYISRNNGDDWSNISSGMPDSSTVWTFVVHGTYLYAGLRLGPYGVWRRPLSEIVSSVKEMSEKISFRIYPNPGKGLFSISLQKPTYDPTIIELVTLTGASVFCKQVEGNFHFQEVDFSSIHPGIYFVFLKSGYRQLVQKLVID